jgi:hypothetical protein
MASARVSWAAIPSSQFPLNPPEICPVVDRSTTSCPKMTIRRSLQCPRGRQRMQPSSRLDTATDKGVNGGSRWCYDDKPEVCGDYRHSFVVSDDGPQFGSDNLRR